MATESTPGLLAWLRRDFRFIFGRVRNPPACETNRPGSQDKDHPATLFDFFHARGRADDKKANKLTNDIERTLRRAVVNQNWRNVPANFQQVAKLTHEYVISSPPIPVSCLTIPSHYYEAVLIAILNYIAVTDKWMTVFKHMQLIEYLLRTGSRRHFYYTRSRINRIKQVVIKHPCRAGWSDAIKQRIDTQMRLVVRLVTEHRYTAVQSEPRRVWEPRITDTPIQDDSVGVVATINAASNTDAPTAEAVHPAPRNLTRVGSRSAAAAVPTNDTFPPGTSPPGRPGAQAPVRRPSANQAQKQGPYSTHPLRNKTPTSVPASADTTISPSTSVRTTSTAAASRRSRPSMGLSSTRDSVAWLASVRGIEIGPTEYCNYGHNPPSSAGSSSSTHYASTQASSVSANSAREPKPGVARSASRSVQLRN
ncbi:unnamed protein product [Clonostachys byssicola]|uniref:ENTH domain-containing protein n=1 Tax=Clonostachys byssicola TaxID=160290 RepID=A0A9N9XYJ1_9HYPO|nr:unnamed protein product [Clonostachys byssicola]